MGNCCKGSNIWTSLALAGAVLGGTMVVISSNTKASDETSDQTSDQSADVENVALVAELDESATPTAQPEGQPDDMAAMMQAWMEFGAPDEHHEVLKAFVGDWTAHSINTMTPGAPPEESTGSETNDLILGGRYVTTHHTGNFAGMPFEGYGAMGYDKMEKKYTSVWLDNFSTTIANSSGTYDADTHSLTLNSKMKDLMGNTVQQKTVHKIINDDKRTLTFYERQSSDDEWYQSMIITYTRK